MRRSQTAFVDEHRIFAVSSDLSPSPRWSVTLFDTSAPVEDPQRPKEIEYELEYDESPRLIHLTKGTHPRGARLGSPFQTDHKRHVLGIISACPTSACSRTIVIDYESIRSIASENEIASRIPWDLWKNKTNTLIDRHMEPTTTVKFVGPRILAISEDPHQDRFSVRSILHLASVVALNKSMCLWTMNPGMQLVLRS